MICKVSFQKLDFLIFAERAMLNSFVWCNKIRKASIKHAHLFWIIELQQQLILVLLCVNFFSQSSFSTRLIQRFQLNKNKNCAPSKRYSEVYNDSSAFLARYRPVFVWAGDPDLTWSVNLNEKLKMNCNDLRYMRTHPSTRYSPGPPLFVKWFKDGKDFNENQGNFSLSGCTRNPFYVRNRLSLHVRSFNDTGFYQCKIYKNDTKKLIKSRDFTVFVTDKNNYSPPISLSNSLTHMKDSEGAKERALNCSYAIVNDSPVTVIWYKDNERQPQNESVLNVCYPGKYRCEVKNYLGGFTKRFQVYQKDVHCRSDIAMLIMTGSLMLGFVLVAISTVHCCYRRIFNSQAKEYKMMLKVSHNWAGYGMHLSEYELEEAQSSRDDSDLIQVNHKEEPRKYYTQQIVASFADQLEDPDALSKEDWDLLKENEINRARLVFANKNSNRVELGSGFFGKVYKGFLINNDGVKTPVAIKMLKSTEMGIDFDHFIEEATTLIKSSGHANIISLLGTCILDAMADQKKMTAVPLSPILIMELADGGNLHSYLIKCRDYCRPCSSNQKIYSSFGSFNELVSICHQVALGMDYLAKKKILHRDLAARNVLLTKDKVVKIGDFGLSKHLLVKSYYRIRSRWEKPVKWTSPEALMQDKYTVWSDVWSYGVLMWEVFSLGADPYKQIHPTNIYNFLQSGGRLSQPELATKQIYDCMMGCWAWTPHLRKTFSSIIEEFGQLIDQQQPANTTSKNPSILDSNHFYNNHEKKNVFNDRKSLPSIKLMSQSSLSSHITKTEEQTTSSASTNGNKNDFVWPQFSETESPVSTEYPSLDSSEDTNSADNETPYIAQVPNKPVFVLKQAQQHMQSAALPLYCALPSEPPILSDGLMLVNQSYQSKKNRLASVESPTANYSDISTPNDNESVFEREVDPYVYNDLYFEVGL